MIYGGSMILPLRSGYTPELPRAVTVTTLLGGPSSQRRTGVTPITDVTVQYLLSSCFMVEWYKAWYRRETLEGALPFTARLAVDNATFADYTVQFAASPTISHAGYRGLLSCRYEVLSRDTTAIDNCNYLTLYDALGNCVSCSLEELHGSL